MPLRHSPPAPTSQHIDARAPLAQPSSAAGGELRKELSASQLQQSSSDAEGTKSEDTSCKSSGITQRQKRKRRSTIDIQLANFMSEMRGMFADLKKQQESKMDKLCATFQEIKNQNTEIKTSIEFLTSKYDSLLEEVNDLKKEKSQNLAQIQSLENRLENFERNARSTCLEIKNLPVSKPETKAKLMDTVTKIGSVLNFDIQKNDIRDIFRINTRNPENKTLIVELTSVITKDSILKAYKQYNRGPNRLNTEHLKIDGSPKPIFISENLTAKMKRLFYTARVFASSNGYKYCWSSNGKIFIREKDGSPYYMIRDELDLKKLERLL